MTADPLQRWRETRDPRIGKAIVEAPPSEEIDDPFAAVDDLPAKKQTALLLAAVLAPIESTAVPALAAAIDRLARSRRLAWDVIERIADRDPDPRWAWLALSLLADFDHLSPKSAKLWRRLVDAVEQHGDAAFGAALARLPPSSLESAQTRSRLANVSARLAKRTTVPVDDAALAIWHAALERRPDAAPTPPASPADAADGSALLAAVYADPDDLAARSVYADWLVAHADPRGEFIHLQLQRTAGTLTPAGAKRELALLRRHATEWLWPLADQLGPRRDQRPRHVDATELAVPELRLADTTFANGFVAQLQPCGAKVAVLETPMIATVTRALGLQGFAATMRGLREAHIDTTDALSTIDRLPRPLAVLGARYFAPKDVPALRGVAQLDVTIDDRGQRSWVELLQDNPAIERLIVRYGLRGAWGPALEPDNHGAPRLREVVLVDGARTMTVTRPAATRWVAVAIHDAAPRPELVDEVVACFAALARLGPDRGPVERLVWHARRDPFRTAPAMRTALARLARDVEVVVG